jgi:hypothetical protein
MKRHKLKKIGILKRAFNSSVATSFARALRLINNKPFMESGSQTYLKELPKPYIPYDELRTVRLQLLELERQRAEAICLARRHFYT